MTRITIGVVVCLLVVSSGAPVGLNAEIKVLADSKTQTTFLVFIASPQPKSHPIWRALYQIQKDFVLPAR